MAEMVKGHEKAAALFSKESSAGRDADAKSWAAQTLPTIQKHLSRARELAKAPAGGAHAHTH